MDDWPDRTSRAQYSVISKSDCSKYGFGRFLWSPEFFQGDKLANWRTLERMSGASVADYFDHIKETVKAIDRPVICYDLTDGIAKFFDTGTEVQRIGSTKKVAREGDFLISRMRSYLMEMGIVEQREREQLFSTEFLVFREKTETLSAQTLFALCLTDTVQTILKRSQYGTEHPRFYDFLMESLPVPDCLRAMDGNIRQIISRAAEVRAYSRQLYAAAQSTLLSELGLADWQPRRQSTFVRNFADLGQAGRMDSDYFQPKYGEIVDAIKGYAGGWATLGELVTLRKCIEVGSGEYRDAGIPFVRVSNLSPFEITEEKYISESLYSEIAQHQPQQGEILLTKDATPGIAHYLSEPPPPLIPSGGILRLRSKTDRLNNECLTLLLNSLLTKEQANRDAGGSVIMHWRPEQIGQVVIPIIAPESQGEIREQVAESAALRRQSRRLLELAKGAVELAIERDEALALGWLAGEVGDLVTLGGC